MGLFSKKEQAPEEVIYQSGQFDANIKVTNLMTNPAAAGDVAHFVFYGFTMGGAMHQMRRNANWAQLSENVYNQAVNNPTLRGFRAEDNSQVVVAGYQYFSVYQSGEFQKKIVYYKDIVKIVKVGEQIRVMVRLQNGDYGFVALAKMQGGAENLLNSLIFYMKKSMNRK